MNLRRISWNKKIDGMNNLLDSKKHLRKKKVKSEQKSLKIKSTSLMKLKNV